MSEKNDVKQDAADADGHAPMEMERSPVADMYVCPACQRHRTGMSACMVGTICNGNGPGARLELRMGDDP